MNALRIAIPDDYQDCVRSLSCFSRLVGHWQGPLGRLLLGSRLGIWSYGRIGRQVAAYGRAFGMRVWVWGREDSTSAARADGFEVAPSRDAFCSDSDAVSLHLRSNAQTRGIVTATDLARMRPDSVLVNPDALSTTKRP